MHEPSGSSVAGAYGLCKLLDSILFEVSLEKRGKRNYCNIIVIFASEDQKPVVIPSNLTVTVDFF